MAETKAAAKARDNRGRADQNRAIRMEALRNELKGKEYLQQIETAYKEFKSIGTSVKKLKLTKTFDLQLKRAEARCKVLKHMVDINFRRLNKILPDVKDVIISDPDGNNPLNSFAETMAQATKDANK